MIGGVFVAPSSAKPFFGAAFNSAIDQSQPSTEPYRGDSPCYELQGNSLLREDVLHSPISSGPAAWTYVDLAGRRHAAAMPAPPQPASALPHPSPARGSQPFSPTPTPSPDPALFPEPVLPCPSAGRTQPLLARLPSATPNGMQAASDPLPNSSFHCCATGPRQG